MTDKELELREREIAAQEKQAEAALITARATERYNEIRANESEDRKVLLTGFHDILTGVAQYFNAMTQVELGRASMYPPPYELPAARKVPSGE